ncbi:DUF3278 domain-containing protein [Streptococcus sanguinis]|uniref:DUF3278 domain-containing protein n=1 Tax=Streptococcus sanguinis TaxID=1305 RepID=UPI001CBE9793|nr:DUF3278 domain-containing protein [Streptococcus sanguinis]MBZ2038097.1 DUF3278 domain-containing protein [Streptococcus sanguinis]MBZ2069030.1 DUF3278 domain-containing protein [Streptococcus sanguinis]MBZ2070479.1 DUF3278 domain-containing protein [Streptococcus sanguinis]MCC3168690.1 hypothetical protein [Streptococcus sanguinis]
MKKETFSDKMIKRFYGITGPLDEQKRQQAEHLGNIGFIWLFFILIFGNAIAFPLAFRWPNIIAVAYPILLEILILGFCVYIVIQARRKGIDDLELGLQDEKEEKAMKHAGLKAGFSYWLLFYPLFGIMIAVMEKKDILQILLQPKLIITGLAAGLGFGLIMHFIAKGKIRQAQKKEEEDL